MLFTVHPDSPYPAVSVICYFCSFQSNRQHTSPFSEEIPKTIPGACRCSTLSANKFSLVLLCKPFHSCSFLHGDGNQFISFSLEPFLTHFSPRSSHLVSGLKEIVASSLSGGMQGAVPPLSSHDVPITRSCTGSYTTPEC